MRLIPHQFPALFKCACGVMLALLVSDANALGPRPDFGVMVGSAILCRDKMDMKFFYDYLKSSFGNAYKRDQGAYWFRAQAQLFGKQTSDVFISDQSSEWVFIGVIFKTKPSDLAQAVRDSTGVAFDKTYSGYQYSPYQTQGTSEIMWQTNDSKLLCRRYTGGY